MNDAIKVDSSTQADLSDWRAKRVGPARPEGNGEQREAEGWSGGLALWYDRQASLLSEAKRSW